MGIFCGKEEGWEDRVESSSRVHGFQPGIGLDRMEAAIEWGTPHTAAHDRRTGQAIGDVPGNHNSKNMRKQEKSNDNGGK